MAKPTLVGRSSSHFTRVTRIFAAELQIDCDFEIVRDLLSQDPADWGGNPALKLPSLRTDAGVWFGSLPICRELWRRSAARPRVVWPEDLDQPLLANAQELVVQAMSTEVALIMSRVGGAVSEPSVHQIKMRESLLGSMAWLEENAAAALAALPQGRSLSFLEVTLYCLVSHLDFREVLPVSGYRGLAAFCEPFQTRPSVMATAYRFDA